MPRSEMPGLQGNNLVLCPTILAAQEQRQSLERNCSWSLLRILDFHSSVSVLCSVAEQRGLREVKLKELSIIPEDQS
ncbi:hypothetical protein FHG87_011330 [Trinorchestia longiramus]|nr:hypothetical protein FHG87_011330 [Trinorchestia longiramus]